MALASLLCADNNQLSALLMDQMRPLTTNELTRLRDTAETILTETCTIQTATETPDDMGGFAVSFANTYTSVPSKLELGDGASSRANQGDRFAVADGWLLRVAYDQAIASGDRVVMNSDTFEVVSVEDDHTLRTVRRAMLKRIEFDG